MKYAMLIYHQERPSEERAQSDLAPWIEFSREAATYGTELAGAPLDLVKTAKVARQRNKELLVTDGPFADTKEQLCGYYLFDCENREQALQIAAMIPVAQIGHIEVRPVIEFEGRG